MLNSEILPRIREICKHPCGQRLSGDIKFLMSVTKEIKLFKDLIQKQGEYYHSLCCQYLLYEYVESHEYIFKQGDIGNKYYILLSGQVSIEISSNESGHRSIMEIMTYTSGTSFGELALESSKPRSASAFCKTPSHLLALTKIDYSRLMQRIVTDKKNEMTDFLQSLPAFQKVNRLALSKLTYNIVEKNFTKGQYLFREGDEAREILIIFSGECKLCKSLNKPSSSTGMRKACRSTVHTAKRIGRGAMIGEEDIFKKVPHSYSCICSSDALIVYSIPSREFFTRITAEQPLRYLREVSDEKCRFFESWTNVRSSLDLIFVNRKLEKAPVEVDPMMRLNSAITHRKFMTESHSKGFIDNFNKNHIKLGREKSVREIKATRKAMAINSMITLGKSASINTSPVSNSNSIIKTKHRKMNTFFELKKFLPAR